MSDNRIGSTASWQFTGLACLLLLIAALVAARGSRAEAEVRRTKPQAHFKSGAQRSEALLSEILTTLRRMDERLARLERNFKMSAADPQIVEPRGGKRQP